MSLSNWLDWAAVFGYIAIAVFVMYRVFLTNSD
jgi:hypothetical protein